MVTFLMFYKNFLTLDSDSDLDSQVTSFLNKINKNWYFSSFNFRDVVFSVLSNTVRFGTGFFSQN